MTIKHACADNLLSLTSDLSIEIYYIDYPNTDGLSSTGNKVITPGISKTVAACPLIATLQMWNSASKTWTDASTQAWVQAFDSATGVLTVWTGSLTYHPIVAYPNNAPWTDINLRLTWRDQFSLNQPISDEFTLSIRRPCSDSTLTQTGDISDFVYYINSGDSAAIVPSFTNIAGDGVTVCPPFFFLHFWNNSKKAWVEYTVGPAYPFVKTWDAAAGSLVINTN